MKVAIIAFVCGVAIAGSADAMSPCPLCNLGQVIQGMNGQAPQYYYQPPQNQPAGPQFHSYEFPGGHSLNCTTMLAGTPAATTTCN